MDDRDGDDSGSSSSSSGSCYNAATTTTTTVVQQQQQLKKRRRTNKQEQAILEALFASSRTPSQAAREKVCTEINMSMKKLQVWLQNRRQKEKKDAGKWKPAYDSTGATTTSTAATAAQQSTSIAGSVSASNDAGRTSPFSGASESASASAVFSSSSPQLPSHAPAPVIHVQHAAQAAPIIPSPSPSSACATDSKLRLPSIRTIIPASASEALTPNQLPSLQRSLSLPSVAALAGDGLAHPRAPMQPRSASYSQTSFIFPPTSATFTHGAPGSARAIFGQLSSRPKAAAVHAPIPEPEKRKRRTVVAARPLWEGMPSDPVEPQYPTTTTKMPDDQHQGEIVEDEGFVASPTESLGSQASSFSKGRPSTTASLLTATTLSGKGSPARRNSVRMEDILGSAGRNASDRGAIDTATAAHCHGRSSAAAAKAAGRKRTYSRTLSISHHPNGVLQRSASTGSLSEAAARVFAEMPSSPPVPAPASGAATQEPGSSPVLSFGSRAYSTAATRPRIQARALSSAAGMNFQNMLALPRPQLFRSRSFQDRTGNTVSSTTLASHHSNNTPASLSISSARSRPSLGTPTFSSAAAGMRPALAQQAGSSASKKSRRTAGSIHLQHHPNFAQFSDSSDMEEEEPELSFAASSTSAASSILDVSLCTAAETDAEDIQDRDIRAASVRKQSSVDNFAGKGSAVEIVDPSGSLKKRESIRSSVTTTSARNILAPLKMGHGQSQPLAPSAARQGAGEAQGKKKLVSQMERDAAAVLAGLGFGQ